MANDPGIIAGVSNLALWTTLVVIAAFILAAIAMVASHLYDYAQARLRRQLAAPAAAPGPRSTHRPVPPRVVPIAPRRRVITQRRRAS